MLLNFLQEITLVRSGTGSYVNGRWVDGAPTSTTIKAVVQPDPGTDAEDGREGEHPEGTLKVWTDTPLVAAAGPNQKADRLIIDGVTYEAWRVMKWSGGLPLDHYQARCKRIGTP